MRLVIAALGLSISLLATASSPTDYAKLWPLDASGEGAYAVHLDASVYREITHSDLSDLAAFNDDGEPLPFGPLPESVSSPASHWRDAVWFVLPESRADLPSDLNLHITRSASGDLSLDSTLSHGAGRQVNDVLIDVRAAGQAIEALELGFALDAGDFSSAVVVEASDDLASWRVVVPSANVAQLRQGGQSLVRRHVPLPSVVARYLRLHVIDTGRALPLIALRLQLRPADRTRPGSLPAQTVAESIGRDGKAFLYRAPGPIPTSRVIISLGDDNTIAEFSVSARDPGDTNWTYIGQTTAFRLRGAGLILDNEAMEIAVSRLREWRIESNIELRKPPVLTLSFQPDTWLVLTHGKTPFVIAAGSRNAGREVFPLDVLVGQIRAHYGQQWQPIPTRLGPVQTAGGDAVLRGFNAGQKRTWLLWGVLLLGAGAVIVMVVKLLKSPPKPS